jgi:hypothetical protein
MKRLVLMATVIAMVGIAAMPASADAGKTRDRYVVNLHPLNDSGVIGRAVVRMRDGEVRVSLIVRHLDSGLVHVQHIHGVADTNATCPTPDRDVNGDGFVDVGEGAVDYGPVLLSLWSDPSAAPGISNFPVANMAGITRTRATYTATDAGEPVSALTPLESRTIVIHGLDINGNGVYDDGFETAMPVACGELIKRG